MLDPLDRFLCADRWIRSGWMHNDVHLQGARMDGLSDQTALAIVN